EKGNILLAWSYILDYENAANPYEIRREAITEWKKKSFIFVTGYRDIQVRARELATQGLKAKDALDIACAIKADCDYFITTDDQITNKADEIRSIEVLNPVDLLKIIE